MVDIEKFYSLTPALIGLLDNPKKKGFIVRIQNPADVRSELVSLSDKVDSMQSELEGLGDALENKMPENFTVTERHSL